MKKYKRAEYDPANDIWLLKKRVLLFFWVSVSVGSKEKIDQAIKQLQLEEE